MKKGILAFAAAIVVSSFSYGVQTRVQSPGCLDCFNFVAPTILGAENVAPAEVGLIVYDSYLNMFRGYTNAGTWSKLSKENTIKTVGAGVSAATVATTDDIVMVNASASAPVINLPPASAVNGKEIVIKKTDSTFGVITIDPYSTETIDSNSTRKLSTKGETIKIVSDGASWQIIERRIPSEWIPYNPTYTNFGSVTSSEVFYRRVGDSIEIRGSFVTGTGAAAEAKIGLPSGLTSTSLSSIKIVGTIHRNINAPAYNSLIEPGVTYLTFANQPGVSAFGKINGNSFNTSEKHGFHAFVQIEGWEG